MHSDECFTHAHTALKLPSILRARHLLGKADEVLVVRVHVRKLDIDVDEKVIFALLFSFSYV